MRRKLEQDVLTLDLEKLGGVRRTIGANAPIVLSDPEKVLLVLSGHVDVFAVRFVDGEPFGSRHPVFRAGIGEVVFGLPHTRTGGFVLIAVGAGETEVMADVPAANCRVLRKDHLAALLDRFVGNLSDPLVRIRPSSNITMIDPDQTRDIPRGGAIVGPSHRSIWVSAVLKDSAAPCLFGDGDLCAPLLPVSSVVWAEMTEPTKVQAVEVGTLIENDAWRSALEGYLDVYGILLGKTILKLEAETEQAQAARQAANAVAIDGALRDMMATVYPNAVMDHPAMDSENRLRQAFVMVADALGIDASQADPSREDLSNLRELDALALSCQIRTRKVMLRLGWQKEDAGPLLAYMEDTLDPVALLPRKGGGYDLFDPETGQRTKCDADMADRLHGEAVMLYRPLPISVRDLKGLVHSVLPLVKYDLRQLAVMGFAGGVLGALTPVLTGILVSEVLPRAVYEHHIQIILALVLAAFGAASFEVVKALTLLRIEGRADMNLQAGLFDRVLRLPTGFFRGFTSGDLTDRVMGVQTIRQTLTGTTVQGLLGASFSILSLALLAYYNWRLSFVAVALVLISIVVTAWLGKRQLTEERERIRHQGIAEGLVVQIFTGLAKLRVAAAETRAYAQWARHFTQQKRRFRRAQVFANQQELFQSVFPILAAAVIFVSTSSFMESAVLQNQVEALVDAEKVQADVAMSVGDFVAFNTAFGQFLAAMTAMVTALTKSLTVVPMFERLRSIVTAEPETGYSDKTAPILRGGVELSHVSFRYHADGPLALENLSMSVNPNETIAIVGPSGSGKSTIMRLLLGFEQCENGEVLYDGAPLGSLDITAVRQQVQVVLQHGRLTSGSILSNIVGDSTFTLEDAWQATSQAGLEEDIKALPMGMHTVLTEGVNVLSGGQRQRLMIARALIHRPRLLLLDEPTSALDNTTQSIVMNSLANLSATKIIIAHRLSTLREVDRIVVLENGKVVEEGSYEDLMAADGPFSVLARRQLT